MSAAEIDCFIEGMFTQKKKTVPFSFGSALTNIVQHPKRKRRLELRIIPTWRRTYSYGILKIMVAVKFFRAESVLRSSEAVFCLRDLKKNLKVFITFRVTPIAHILISTLKYA